jgi:hypothetical protein
MSLAFPDHEHMPAEKLEAVGGSAITGRDSLELWYPVRRISLWGPRKATSRVLMPKASVDEDREAQPWEDDVGGPRQLTPVQSESKARFVKNSTSCYLGARVLRTDAPHSAGDFRVDSRSCRTLRDCHGRITGVLRPPPSPIIRAVSSAFGARCHSEMMHCLAPTCHYGELPDHAIALAEFSILQ